MKPGEVQKDVKEQLKAVPFSTATVKADTPRPIVQYVLENGDDFPGVEVERVFLRSYPHRDIGAHLFGTVGELNKEQQEDQRYRGVALGDRVGPVGHRVPVRPLPARQERRQQGSGRRARARCAEGWA